MFVLQQNFKEYKVFTVSDNMSDCSISFFCFNENTVIFLLKMTLNF